MTVTAETIKFEFIFEPVYWDAAPTVEILVDNCSKFKGAVTTKENKIAFYHDLAFDQAHELIIIRYGKEINQTRLTGDIQDQILKITNIVIDGVDIQNIIWSRSYFEPEYPEPWATEQTNNGIILEKAIPGETWLGHNGTWTLQFASPFYKFLMDAMNGKI
jgi:hypothetical protein